MALLEDDTRVFIVRIWREKQETPESSPLCRGVVEHLGSRDRRYFVRMAELVEFLLAHSACPGLDRARPTVITRMTGRIRSRARRLLNKLAARLSILSVFNKTTE